MFFWFFPAEENPETAPVVIWLQGGPAEGLFVLKLYNFDKNFNKIEKQVTILYVIQ